MHSHTSHLRGLIDAATSFGLQTFFTLLPMVVMLIQNLELHILKIYKITFMILQQNLHQLWVVIMQWIGQTLGKSKKKLMIWSTKELEKNKKMLFYQF